MVDNFAKVVELRLSPKRFKHTLGVAETAEELAHATGVCVEKARVAALLHDYARELSPETLKGLAREANLDDQFSLNQPELLHASVGAFLVQRELGVTDQEILDAIISHTVGRRKMNTLEQIIYLADMIEPNRDYAGVQELRAAASQNLKTGVVAALDHTIRYLLNINKPIHLHTIDARNYFLMGGD
jgi:predicted HD superfamily hydrolase involved in NAD metabolism